MKSKMICNTVLPLIKMVMCTITILMMMERIQHSSFVHCMARWTKIIIIIMTKVSIHEMG